MTNCRVGEGDLNIACIAVLYLNHNWQQVLFTLAILFFDILEITQTMARWNVRTTLGLVEGTRSRIQAAGAVVLEQHAKFLNNYMGRSVYTMVCVHFALRAFRCARDTQTFTFGEFHEQYCQGEDREALFCYRYNKQNKKL